ncbi:acyl-CoA thioesterase [Microbacterium sp.]|uniref:acyl-CoA thioesterase n=2 Tax=Micrococcales TaxID=85006 RepID=UPI001AC2012D|nr:hotdog domain-containing protein [Microbacterium sp.]MBN9184965.1 acyl-CoA thioesterase [Microbacterium sp.]MBN9190834.1 acyl-CoA thioesterase [Microbacterium sp.]MBN9193047.1 acyl-CoA thioesterase [Microbacterium sp.]
MANAPGRATRRDDRITLRFLAAPADTAAGGRSVAAGSVMEWIDKAGYACAVGWAGAYCVTAYVGNVRHRRPIAPGSLIEVQARLIHTGRSSMHVVVTVSSSEVSSHAYTPATTCILVFVAKGADGRPTAVPAWTPVSRSDRKLAAAAIDRMPARAEIKRLMLDEDYGGPSEAPRVTMRFLVPPGVVNWGGNAHGGTVMRWIDEAAYACAASWARDGDAASTAVAVYSGGIHFFAPVRIGDLVEVDARIIYTSAHSMHLSIRVSSADPREPDALTLTTQCMSVFVVPDDGGSARPVPPWQPTAEGDVRLWEHAREIIRLREHIVPIPASLTLED